MTANTRRFLVTKLFEAMKLTFTEEKLSLFQLDQKTDERSFSNDDLGRIITTANSVAATDMKSANAASL